MVDNGGPADPKHWPAGVAPLPSYTGAPAAAADAGDRPTQGRRRLTATVRRGKKGGAMEMTLPGLQASLQAGAHAGQIDHVTVDDGARAIGYSPGASTPFGGTLVSAPGGAAKSSAADRARSERLVEFQTTSTRGGEDRVAFAHGRAFTHLPRRGAGGALADPLELRHEGAPGGGPAAEDPPGARGEADRAPTNWRQLGAARVRLTSSVHGRTSTRFVKGRRARPELRRGPQRETHGRRLAGGPGAATEARAEGGVDLPGGRGPAGRPGRREVQAGAALRLRDEASDPAAGQAPRRGPLHDCGCACSRPSSTASTQSSVVVRRRLAARAR